MLALLFPGRYPAIVWGTAVLAMVSLPLGLLLVPGRGSAGTVCRGGAQRYSLLVGGRAGPGVWVRGARTGDRLAGAGDGKPDPGRAVNSRRRPCDAPVNRMTLEP